jgi:arylsulfatase A-like enzyme
MLGVLSCAPRDDRGERAPLNVLFLTVDTLRQDRLSAYGYPRPVSPWLDRFARDAVLFEQACAQAPWTLASYATLMTSRYPSRHGAVWARTRISAEEISLADLLQDAGWETRAYINNAMLGPAKNLSQGFGVYDHDEARPRRIRTAAETAALIVTWLETRPRDAPFFLLVNLMEPHADYFPSAIARERFDPGYEGPYREGFPEYGIPAQLEDREDAVGYPEAVRRHARSLYDAEISEVDRGCGAILAGLERLDLLERTIVVFLSDHGEELWDHGRLGHDHTLYEELLRVPLVVRMPAAVGDRWPRARRGIERAPVGLIDVAPTILDLLGMEPPPPFEGASFASIAPANRFVFAEATLHGGQLKSITEDGWKLVLEVFLGERTLHHLPTDPAERKDLAAEQPEKVEELVGKLVDVARLTGGGLRMAARGAHRGTIVHGRVETTGTIAHALPHALEAFQNTRRDRERIRDVWKVEDGGRVLEFTFRMDLDVDGLTVFVDPPDAETEWTLTIDGTADPARVRLGADGRSPPAIPFRVSPDSIVCPPLEPPRGWLEGDGPALAIWAVEGSGPAWSGEQVDLAPEEIENLRALGYVD